MGGRIEFLRPCAFQPRAAKPSERERKPIQVQVFGDQGIYVPAVAQFGASNVI
jgi:hypothetical protein